jgi:hypothetical protein
MYARNLRCLQVCEVWALRLILFQSYVHNNFLTENWIACWRHGMKVWACIVPMPSARRNFHIGDTKARCILHIAAAISRRDAIFPRFLRPPRWNLSSRDGILVISQSWILFNSAIYSGRDNSLIGCSRNQGRTMTSWKPTSICSEEIPYQQQHHPVTCAVLLSSQRVSQWLIIKKR